jgi:hypothetical protein
VRSTRKELLTDPHSVQPAPTVLPSDRQLIAVPADIANHSSDEAVVGVNDTPLTVK